MDEADGSNCQAGQLESGYFAGECVGINKRRADHFKWRRCSASFGQVCAFE